MRCGQRISIIDDKELVAIPSVTESAARRSRRMALAESSLPYFQEHRAHLKLAGNAAEGSLYSELKSLVARVDAPPKDGAHGAAHRPLRRRRYNYGDIAEHALLRPARGNIRGRRRHLYGRGVMDMKRRRGQNGAHEEFAKDRSLFDVNLVSLVGDEERLGRYVRHNCRPSRRCRRRA
ncbi:MAG: hypothetical protein ACLUEQ_06210 [Cloacibacillus evryensis]